MAFDVPFSTRPAVLAVPLTTVPQNVSVAVNNISSDGFTIYMRRTSSVNTAVQWVAIGA